MEIEHKKHTKLIHSCLESNLFYVFLTSFGLSYNSWEKKLKCKITRTCWKNKGALNCIFQYMQSWDCKVKNTTILITTVIMENNIVIKLMYRKKNEYVLLEDLLMIL